MDFNAAMRITERSPGMFEAEHNPEKMGNSADIAYGGFALAMAVNAAYHTVDSSKFRLYSAQGNYLGPASTKQPLFCSVRNLRSTKTFMTRLAEVSQKQADGKMRVCLVAIADFHVQEPASLLEYSVPQPQQPPADQCLTNLEYAQKLLDDGKITRALANAYRAAFGVANSYFITRPCPDSVGGLKLWGVAKHIPTPQDGRELTQKTSSDWIQCRAALTSPAENAVAMSFYMDGAVAFIPLTHDNKFFDNAGACSSLDFSMRFFDGNLNFSEPHLRELKTISGGGARTYSESRLFKDGKLVASMTQQSILRPKL